MIFSPLSLSSPPFSAVLCDFRWNSLLPSMRNGDTNGFSSTASGCDFPEVFLEGFLLMTLSSLSGAELPLEPGRDKTRHR